MFSLEISLKFRQICNNNNFEPPRFVEQIWTNQLTVRNRFYPMGSMNISEPQTLNQTKSRFQDNKTRIKNLKPAGFDIVAPIAFG